MVALFNRKAIALSATGDREVGERPNENQTLQLSLQLQTGNGLETELPKPEQRLGNDPNQTVLSQPAPAQVPGAPLQIEAVPWVMVVGDRPRFWLIHTESGLAVPGQYTESEAQAIARISSEWDWRIEGDRVPNCAADLVEFLESLCRPKLREAVPGGEAHEGKGQGGVL